MAFKEPSINWNELIAFNGSGDVYIANFVEIQSAIVKRFKEIYGDDIDVSTGTADGVYVQTLSLLINNILQSFKQYFSQLDVRTASGKFLDTLCSLSNITRKQESYSTAVLNITLQGQASYKFTELQFVDINGQTWTYKPASETTLAQDVTVSVVVTCDKSGPIALPANSIKQLVNQDVVMTIEQPQQASVGSYAETDSELRTRQSNVLSSTGNTVLETMAAALYQISGIEDVKIFNNTYGETKTLNDGVSVANHDVYVVVRQQDNITIDDQKIADAIYKHLTPGIRTANAASCAYGIAKSAVYAQSIETTTQSVYWKKATGWAPAATITITPQDNFDIANTPDSIGQACIDYLNSLPIASFYSPSELYSVISNVDPLFKNRATFITNKVMINSLVGAERGQLPYVYFNYTKATSEKQDDGTYIITLN